MSTSNEFIPASGRRERERKKRERREEREKTRDGQVGLGEWRKVFKGR